MTLQRLNSFSEKQKNLTIAPSLQIGNRYRRKLSNLQKSVVETKLKPGALTARHLVARHHKKSAHDSSMYSQKSTKLLF